ncbi:hypothetical protein [Amycolatopsis keratiniphila]|uniref:hypothetical protein n=1 Tax=Amycolatopsis keratiniphila TaxID=129921 RepID=UPI00087BE092|nr:hypothetical protein [Amycolatopsis keratiniphila]OLZ43420.1 hypothetical protein BS330_42815 [Amycolatopsis keratiniphila subsp. nogabecina]SDU59588.1 hypothetical protein SAMN04489733_6717 [Amycolatopsis keratiniphila]SDU59610.1 hypothetical protein SAMN04489733_6721 [Amycolatopsis keratiniphila]
MTTTAPNLSPLDCLAQRGTLALLRFTAGLLAFVLLHLLSLPLGFVLAVVRGAMAHTAQRLADLVDTVQDPAPRARGAWGDRWGEAIPSTRRAPA